MKDIKRKNFFYQDGDHIQKIYFKMLFVYGSYKSATKTHKKAYAYPK